MSIFIQESPNISIDPRHVLDSEGKVLDNNLIKKVSSEQLIDFYKWMLRIRTADTKINNLQLTGQMGTYASVYGQEACQVGAGMALKKEDWLVPTFRETGMMWVFGVPLKNIMLYWKGNELGSKHPEDVNCLPIAIPVGSHLTHATGIAWANKLQKKNSAVLCSFSDGATSTCDFQAALNFAGVLKTANVFFCQNNQYAISTARNKQTASGTIAQKAFAYGIKAMLIDGNDVVAVYLAVQEALEIAKSGQSVLIEAVTYRLGNHTSSDNAKLYREDSEVQQHLLNEPVIRLKKYLLEKKLWDEKQETDLIEISKIEVNKIAEEVLAEPKLDKKEMFEKLYETMPDNLREQINLKIN